MRNYKPKICSVCGKSYTPTGSGSKYCSKRCCNVIGARAEATRRFRRNNPTYYRDKNRELRKSNPAKVSLYQRNRALKLNYGITQKDYEKMFKKQRGRCAICRLAGTGQIGKNYLCVDHDHKTGKIRGLLCQKCNRGIGLLSDSVKNLGNALAYLKGELPCQNR